MHLTYVPNSIRHWRHSRKLEFIIHGYMQIVTSHPFHWIFEPPRNIFIEELKDQYVSESAQFKKFIFG